MLTVVLRNRVGGYNVDYNMGEDSLHSTISYVELLMYDPYPAFF